MSISVKNSNGDWVQCAGQGRAEYGASTVRTGSKTSDTTSWATQETGTFTITFDSPMPDSDYILEITVDKSGVSHEVTEKTASGFKCRAMNVQSGTISSAITLSYTAFKLYTDTEYNQVLNSVPELVEITSLSDVRALPVGKVYDLWVKSPITISGITIPKFAECVYFKPVLNRDQTLSFHNVYTGEGGLACITDVFFNTDGTYNVKQYT